MPEPPEYLQPAVFADIPNVVAGFSTRRGGGSAGPYASLNLSASTGDEPTGVSENRRRLFERLGFGPDQLAVCKQVHGAEVRVVAGPGVYPACDGLATGRPGVVLTISAADCAAVLLADPEAGVVGACHSGWRGTVAGIAGVTVGVMKTLGADPLRIRAYVSPCISAERFETGPEVAALFDPAFVRTPPGSPKPHVDLKAAIRSALHEAGLRPDRIEVSPYCTFARTDLFFSHRAEAGKTGRMMGFIALR